MLGLKAIVFDKDGTLVHFDRTWGPAAGTVIRTLAGGDPALTRALEEVSHYLPDEERFLPSSPLVAGSAARFGPLWALALARPATPDFFSEIDRLFAQAGMKHLTPIGRARDTLQRLHSLGFKLAIATNDAELNARTQAEALGIAPFLTAIHGYDSGFGSKPDPGMLTAFAEQEGLAPHEVALVGDTEHDFSAARSAGVRFILVRSGPMDIAHLVEASDLVLDSVDDLPDRLRARSDQI